MAELVLECVQKRIKTALETPGLWREGRQGSSSELNEAQPRSASNLWWVALSNPLDHARAESVLRLSLGIVVAFGNRCSGLLMPSKQHRASVFALHRFEKVVRVPMQKRLMCDLLDQASVDDSSKCVQLGHPHRLPSMRREKAGAFTPLVYRLGYFLDGRLPRAVIEQWILTTFR